MSPSRLAAVLALLLLTGLLLGADAAGADETDLAKNPYPLLAASARAGDLAVYGVKLGDAVEKIPASAGVNRRPGERSQDAIYAGPNVTYFAQDGRIYRIKLHGELVKAMPPYNTTRLQMKLGKADEVTQPEAGVTSLAYFAMGLQFTFIGPKNIAAVDLYAP